MKKVFYVVKQCYRGCTDLHYVGKHPGTFWFVWMVIMAAYTLSNRGMFAMVTGGITMFITILPLYLYGAYTRAELNDKWSKIQIEKSN